MSLAAKRSRRSSWQIQIATVRALFFRELLTRFGTDQFRLGYAWAVLAPGLQILMMVFIFTVINVRVVPHMDFALFLVSGIVPWMLFSSSASRALGAVEANRGLFNYRPVLPIDTIIARTLLEGILYFAVFVLFLSGLWWLGTDISISHIPLLLVSWLFLWVFSCGFALIMMVIGHWSAEIARFVSILIRIMYFTSGILYSLHVLPEEYLVYVLWNPVPHVIEHMRYALAPAYPIDHVSYSYFLQATLFILFFGLLMYRGAERSMVTTK